MNLPVWGAQTEGMGHDLWVCTLTIYELNDKMDLPGSDEVPSLKLTVRPWKWMVGILLSYWGGLFSGAMLVSGRVLSKTKNRCVFCVYLIIPPVAQVRVMQCLCWWLKSICSRYVYPCTSRYEYIPPVTLKTSFPSSKASHKKRPTRYPKSQRAPSKLPIGSKRTSFLEVCQLISVWFCGWNTWAQDLQPSFCSIGGRWAEKKENK